MSDFGARAIETRYRGHRFRSRLEARWAVFMDHAGVKWQYEAEGFRLGKLWYLPDFYLPRLRAWAEVKHDIPEWDKDWVPTVERAFALCERVKAPVVILESVPESQAAPRSTPWGYLPELSRDPGEMFDLIWTSCLRCGATGFAGEHYDFARFGDGDDIPDEDVIDFDTTHAVMPCGHSAFGTLPRLSAAFAAARAARFEHGERP